MPFVALGAPGIESLRSVEEAGRKVRAAAGTDLLTCDQWNYHFTEVTGVSGPEVSDGCYSGDDRGQRIEFERYFSWLRRPTLRNVVTWMLKSLLVRLDLNHRSGSVLLQLGLSMWRRRWTRCHERICRS